MLYLIIILTFLVFAVSHNPGSPKEKWSIKFTFAFILISSVAAFAFNLGADTEEYFSVFKGVLPVKDITKSYLESFRYQSGFTLFFSVCKQFSDRYLFYQIIHSLIVNFVILRFVYKNTSNPYLTLLFYLILNFLEFNFEIQRESLAIVMGLLGMELWQNKKYLYSCLSFLIGFYFHFSIVGLLLFPILLKIKDSPKSIIMFSTAAAISPWIWQVIPNADLFLLLTSDADFYEGYIKQTLFNNYNLIYYLKFYFTNIAIPLFALYLLRNKQHPYKKMIYGFMIFRCLSLFSYGFYRFSNYYATFYWIVVAEALLVFVRYSFLYRIKFIFYSFSVLLIFWLNSTSLFWYDEDTGKKIYERYFPYKSIFETDKIY